MEFNARIVSVPDTPSVITSAENRALGKGGGDNLQ